MWYRGSRSRRWPGEESNYLVDIHVFYQGLLYLLNIATYQQMLLQGTGTYLPGREMLPVGVGSQRSRYVDR